MPVFEQLYYYEHPATTPLPVPPVILVHGAGSNHLSWPPELRRLPGHRVLAPDLPGHGKSQGYSEQAIHSFSEVIYRWVIGLEVHRFVLVGHSMGGAIALDFALSYPRLLTALVLVGTGARLPVNPTLLQNCAHPATFPSAITSILEWSFSSHANPRTVELVAERFREVRNNVMYNDLLACQNFDRMDDLGRIQVPTLVICGEEDRMTPLRFSQLLAARIPGAALSIIPNAGHMVMLEQPEAVREQLIRFLSSLPE